MKAIYTLAASAALATTASALSYVDLGGPANGYLALTNFKSSSSQNGIEGLDGSGNPSPSHNGLPDYPNYQAPAGYYNEGNYIAIITSPLDTTNDYSGISTNFYGGTPLTINNLTTTQANASTMSAGHIIFDESVLTGVGTETIGVGDLTFDFDIYQWDGFTTGDGGPFEVTGAPEYISPFSPIYTVYNDGSGAGNAQIYYNISIANVTGAGLTFVDGELDSMDIEGDLSVAATTAFSSALSAEFTGTFSATETSYAFDVVDTQSIFIFNNLNMLFNREGEVSVVPEPSTYAMIAGLVVLAGAIVIRRRKNA
ncbi:PEP-CTERM sorting domain-containing protein [Cerasicoccus frondis]|uniref:PEP-CTERM sorting domain-containing protein n=1 Tax=Cerasicoccus frondis TaxID=490090 RepID=UPI0028524E08|nr:PEP-CTERM sorting domain-containing protein [Cerasicoccus frondis]